MAYSLVELALACWFKLEVRMAAVKQVVEELVGKAEGLAFVGFVRFAEVGQEWFGEEGCSLFVR